MADSRRIPGLGAIAAIAFLIVPIVAVAWWLNRPKGETVAGVPRSELDVVCVGRVDGRTPVASLEPTVPGKVVQILVVEGQEVKAKQELLKLDDEALALRVEEAKDALEAAKVEVEIAEWQLKFQPRRRTLQAKAVEAAAKRAASARGLYMEREKAKSFGTVSEGELIAAEAEYKQLEHLVEIERAKLEEADEIDAGLRVRSANARKAMSEVSLLQAKKAVRDCVLLAPSDGVVLRIQTSLGETAAPGGLQPAILFRPESPLVVRAELEQEFLGRVKPGMKATIRDDVRSDSPTWTGTVERIGNWVARKRSFLLDPGEANDVRTAECVIVLDGKPEGLLVGQRMRVRIGKQ